MDVLNPQGVLRRQPGGSGKCIASMGSEDPLVGLKAPVSNIVRKDIYFYHKALVASRGRIHFACCREW